MRRQNGDRLEYVGLVRLQSRVNMLEHGELCDLDMHCTCAGAKPRRQREGVDQDGIVYTLYICIAVSLYMLYRCTVRQAAWDRETWLYRLIQHVYCEGGCEELR